MQHSKNIILEGKNKMSNIELYNCDNYEFLCSENIKGKKMCIITDPPYNVGYHYNSYKDNLPEEEYVEWLGDLLTMNGFPFVIIHYPEMLYKLSFQVGLFPEKIISWVYNSNTARQHRDIAFFGVEPDMNKIKQPYKNINDKRIKERIEKGTGGEDYMIGGISTKSKMLVRKSIIPVLCH